MQPKPVQRVFRHGTRNIPDPDPSLTPEQVRALLTAGDPSFASAVLQGPTYENGTAIYTLTTTVGTKG